MAPPSVINFYTLRNQWGFLSNFYRSPVEVDGKRYPTVEHYFQSMKFADTDPATAERIRQAKSPKEAKHLAWTSSAPMQSGWHSGVSTDMMRRGLEAKFKLGSPLGTKLLATGSARLVEHTWNDNIWGDGGDGSGENRLGKLLMEVREKLRRQQQQQQRLGLSTGAGEAGMEA